MCKNKRHTTIAREQKYPRWENQVELRVAILQSKSMKRASFILAFCLLITGQQLAARQDAGNWHRKSLSFPEQFNDTTTIKKIIREGTALFSHDTAEAEALLSRALQSSLEMRFSKGVILASLNLAAYQMLHERYDQSLDIQNRLLVYLQQTDKTMPAAFPLTYAYMTTAYMKKKDYYRSVYFAYKTLEEAAAIPNPDTTLLHNVLVTYINLSKLLGYMYNQEKSLYYLGKAETLAREKNMIGFLPAILNNKAANAFYRKDYPEAVTLYTKLLDHCMETNDSSMMCIALFGIGDSYSSMGQPDKGIAYLERGVEIKNRLSPSAFKYEYDYHPLKNHYNLLGKTYFQLNDYNRAERALLKGLELAETTGDTLSNEYLILYQLYSQKGAYKKASEFLFRNFQVYTTRLNEKNKELLARAETKYQSSEKDRILAQKQLVLVKQTNELQQKDLWLGGAIAAALIMGVLSAAIYLHSRHKRNINRLNAIVAGEEQERIRIARELHDGIMVQFSAVKMQLSALINRHRDLTDIEHFDSTIRQLDDATRELRRTAHNLMPDILQEEGLMEAVSFFCSNLRQHTSLDIHCQLYGSLPQLREDFSLSVYRIVQELVNNIIKHARATRAVVQLSYQEHLLMVTVEDNGIGFPKGITSENDTGIGLKNVRNRVSSLLGIMDIQQINPTGTMVYIEFDTRHFVRKNKHAHADQSSNN